MARHTIAPLVVLIPLLLAGCADVDGLDQVTTYLPAGTTLANLVLDGPKKSPEITVRDKLKELGAHIGRDQKLCDRTGREIFFLYHGPGQGWADRLMNGVERRKSV